MELQLNKTRISSVYTALQLGQRQHWPYQAFDLVSPSAFHCEETEDYPRLNATETDVIELSA